MNGNGRLPQKWSALDWLKVIAAWLGWILALLQFLVTNPPPR